MLCPKCGDETRVKDVHKNDDVTTRRLACKKCDHRFSTREVLVREEYEVVKSNGELAPFNSASIVESLRQATAGKHHDDKLRAVSRDVFKKVYRTSGGAPVSTEQIGEAVMEHLKQWDSASHIRFALVFDGRTDRKKGAGWEEGHDLREWLEEEYPDLRSWTLTPSLSYVIKKDGQRKGYNRKKLLAAVHVACKGRGTSEEVSALANAVVDEVEETLRGQAVITTGQIAAAVLQILRRKDPIAYLRYAAPVKNFGSAFDYANEARTLRRGERTRPTDASSTADAN